MNYKYVWREISLWYISSDSKNLEIEREMGWALDSLQRTTSPFKVKKIRSHPVISTSKCRFFDDDKGVFINERSTCEEIRGYEVRQWTDDQWLVWMHLDQMWNQMSKWNLCDGKWTSLEERKIRRNMISKDNWKMVWGCVDGLRYDRIE